jgi:hypothetical protein
MAPAPSPAFSPHTKSPHCYRRVIDLGALLGSVRPSRGVVNAESRGRSRAGTVRGVLVRWGRLGCHHVGIAHHHRRTGGAVALDYVGNPAHAADLGKATI